MILARDRVCVCVVWCAMMASTSGSPATVVDDSTPSIIEVDIFGNNGTFCRNNGKVKRGE